MRGRVDEALITRPIELCACGMEMELWGASQCVRVCVSVLVCAVCS